MTDLVPATDIERIVDVTRHPTEHWGKAVSADQRVYILHSQECLADHPDLRDCSYSQALDDGIDPRRWTEDVPLLLTIYDPDGEAWLEPASPQPTAADRGSAPVALLLGLCLLLGFLGLVLVGGQHAMCAIHSDQIRYCPGYTTTSTQETSR